MPPSSTDHKKHGATNRAHNGGNASGGHAQVHRQAQEPRPASTTRINKTGTHACDGARCPCSHPTRVAGRGGGMGNTPRTERRHEYRGEAPIFASFNAKRMSSGKCWRKIAALQCSPGRAMTVPPTANTGKRVDPCTAGGRIALRKIEANALRRAPGPDPTGASSQIDACAGRPVDHGRGQRSSAHGSTSVS